MILRAPSVPLITVDPYFSVWSASDKLTDTDTAHWTSRPNTIKGVLNVDGTDYRFMGLGNEETLAQTDLDVTALTSEYTFEGAGIKLRALFFSTLFPDELDIMTRPVSYLSLKIESTDGEKHFCKAKITVSEEICLDTKGQFPIKTEALEKNGINMIKIGSTEQPILAKSGDNIRIDWGYFYLAAKGAKVHEDILPYTDPKTKESSTMNAVTLESVFEDETLIAFAYDDIYSINYFGDNLKSVWNKDGKTIETAIEEALSDYESLLCRAHALDDNLFFDAVKAGGEKYSDLLRLAFRQVIAAHKAVLDKDGNVLFISKECFSNGCAATVDVSYPSIPMFLIYNPELVLGMLRPIIKFARSDMWDYDFAPHDAGQYPLVTKQVYGLIKETGKYKFESQMPVEECGNMLVMAAAHALAANDFSFAKENMDLFTEWSKYLIKYGADPENQLCTDDFAGHLAHNCNLSLKAVMGLVSMSIMCEHLGMTADAASYTEKARELGVKWLLRAGNGDGSYRLAFDRKGTFSMKYNIVWDKLFGTNIMPHDIWEGEAWSNRRHFNAYGMPLDNRSTYTKSDWMVWTATLLSKKEDFESYIAPLWLAYHVSPSRVPMTDWYYTETSVMRGFQNRTVQGGLFIKLLDYYKTVNTGAEAPKLHIHSEHCSCHK